MLDSQDIFCENFSLEFFLIDFIILRGMYNLSENQEM